MNRLLRLAAVVPIAWCAHAAHARIDCEPVPHGFDGQYPECVVSWGFWIRFLYRRGTANADVECRHPGDPTTRASLDTGSFSPTGHYVTTGENFRKMTFNPQQHGHLIEPFALYHYECTVVAAVWWEPQLQTPWVVGSSERYEGLWVYYWAGIVVSRSESTTSMW